MHKQMQLNRIDCPQPLCNTPFFLHILSPIQQTKLLVMTLYVTASSEALSASGPMQGLGHP